MLGVFALIVGSSFAVTVTIGTVSAIVKKVKSNKADGTDVVTEKPKKDKKTKKKKKVEEPEKKIEEIVEDDLEQVSDKDKILAALQERIDLVKADNEVVDKLIKDKIDSLKLNPDTKEHRDFLTKAMKTRWISTTSGYVSKIEKIMKNVSEDAKYDEVMSKVPTMASAEVFIEKCDNLLSSVSEKYAYYAEEKEKVMKEAVSITQKNMLSKMAASQDIIDALFAKIEGMIIDGTKVASFKTSANADFKTILNEYANLKEFKKVKNNFTALLHTLKDELDSKADKKTIENTLDEIRNQVKENKEKIDLVDLSKVYRTIAALQKKVGVSIDGLKEEMQQLIESKVKDAKENIAKRMKYELSLLELNSIKVQIESLQESYSSIASQIDVTIKNEIESMKVSINKGLSVRIGNALKKRLKDFDEKHKKEIIEETIAKLKTIVDTTVGEKLTEEDVLDAIVEHINNKYKLAKK